MIISLRTTIWKSLKFISSLYFSISLFLLLAIVSMLGTFIEQEQSLDYYKFHYPINKPFLFIITWKKIILLGLNHMYSTYWFFSLLLLFFSSLLICTLSTQLPILKNSRQWKFLYNQDSLKKKNIFYRFTSVSLVSLIYLLNTNNYYVFHKGKGIYAYKGLFGRIAPIFVHISIVITFIGFLLRVSSGFVVQELVPNGELFHSQNIVTSGYLSYIPSSRIGKVNDFFITFNNDKSIQQFYSNISLINNRGQLLSSKYIHVNSPIKFKGLTIYQTDWKLNALRIQIGKSKFVAKNLIKIKLNNSTANTSWSCDLILDQSHKVSIIIPNLSDDLLIYNKDGLLIKSTTYGKWVVLYGVPIIFKDLIVSTGLQMKIDPGLSISYLGFLILMLSIIISYISYSQIWVNQESIFINLSGKTSRSLLFYEEEMVKIYKNIRNLS